MQQQYFTEQAESYEDAYRKVREKYGDNATILMRNSAMIPCGLLGLFRKEGVSVTGIIPQANNVVYPAIGGYSNVSTAPKPVIKEPVSREPLDFDKEKEKILATTTGAKDPTLQMVLSEVRNIKEKIDKQSGEREEHPALGRLDEILCLNDFLPSYRGRILDRVKMEFPLDSLNNFDLVEEKAIEWIGESISIFSEEKFHRRPRIMIVVGPTGVGKTTTIAKLAANLGINENGRKIREIVLVTIDTFRIGAKEQLEAYGKILQMPCHATDDYGELKRIIALNSDTADVILIDTIGKSPRDLEKLGQMKKLLDATGQAEVHLAVSAATKSSDLEDILQQFAPFNYQSVIITKMDETARTGNIIGVLAQTRKPVSYITVGQKVPADIKKATAMDFLLNLEGFKVNRSKLEERFPKSRTGQFDRWS